MNGFIDVSRLLIFFLTDGISVNTLNDKSNVERAFGSTIVDRTKSGNVSKRPVNIL